MHSAEAICAPHTDGEQTATNQPAVGRSRQGQLWFLWLSEGSGQNEECIGRNTWDTCKYPLPHNADFLMRKAKSSQK